MQFHSNTSDRLGFLIVSLVPLLSYGGDIAKTDHQQTLHSVWYIRGSSGHVGFKTIAVLLAVSSVCIASKFPDISESHVGDVVEILTARIWSITRSPFSRVLSNVNAAVGPPPLVEEELTTEIKARKYGML